VTVWPGEPPLELAMTRIQTLRTATLQGNHERAIGVLTDAIPDFDKTSNKQASTMGRAGDQIIS
jgi:hypothetical protein